MGTDIHMACEIRRNGKWELVKDKIFRNSWYDPNSELSICREKYTNIPYDCRCYNLFAILADVRNGSGFAFCRTGDRFNPISESKGYPKDMCDELKEDYLYDDCPSLSYCHSGSWLTLKELLDYDWNQMHRNYGCVCEATYRDFIMKGLHPDTWCSDISGSDIVHISEEEMTDLIQGILSRQENKQYYTNCYFVAKTYKECSGGFYDDVIPILQTLVPKNGTTDDVRIVFDFDS